MLNLSYTRKLEHLRLLAVPAIFTTKQFDVLVKKFENKKLSQTERNYLSNSIKSKIKGVLALKHLNLFQIYLKENKKKLILSIIASYRGYGINLFGYENLEGKQIAPTELVKAVLNNYQDVDTRIADLLPVYISKNKNKINLFEIYDFAVENSLVNLTGYIFEIVQKHSFCNEFKNFLAALENRKDNSYTVRDKRYESAIDLIEQDNISRKWKFITLNKFRDYKAYFRIYA